MPAAALLVALRDLMDAEQLCAPGAACYYYVIRSDLMDAEQLCALGAACYYCVSRCKMVTGVMKQ